MLLLATEPNPPSTKKKYTMQEIAMLPGQTNAGISQQTLRYSVVEFSTRYSPARGAYWAIKSLCSVGEPLATGWRER